MKVSDEPRYQQKRKVEKAQLLCDKQMLRASRKLPLSPVYVCVCTLRLEMADQSNYSFTD